MSVRYRARWVLPIVSPPLEDGWVTIDAGRIVSTGRGTVTDGVWTVDLGETAILPGLVNAHTHLELSYLRDAVLPSAAFVEWIGGIMAARRARPDPESAEIVQAVDRGIEEALACGTALVGDISNTLVTFDPLARSALGARVFYELIKFNPEDADALVGEAVRQLATLSPTDTVRPSLAAHAPYSVAPAVLRAVRRAVDAGERSAATPFSIHLAESAEEVEFIARGTGGWRSLLERIGAWDPGWQPAGGSPVEYVDACGFLDRRLVAVHGVQMSEADLALLARRGVTLVTCPRSNRHTGAGVPPIEAFYRSGVAVAVGTDSLASAPDLNLFGELENMRALAPSVGAAALLASATMVGARALGFGDDFGSIESGRRDRLIAVSMPWAAGSPASAVDVEEYLVSGVRPDAVQWVTDGGPVG